MSLLSKNGQTSYALYAVHYPIMIAFVMMAPQSSTDIQVMMIAAVSAIFSIIISYPLSSIIDQKAINFSKKYIMAKAKVHEGEMKFKTALHSKDHKCRTSNA
jgi:peptidoglycan/LPS O-acetylase OafA/YrhL